MNRAGVEMVDYDRIFDLIPDVVNALQSASIDELIEAYNQWDDADGLVYHMYEFDDAFGEWEPNATPFDIASLVSDPDNLFDPNDEYFMWDGYASSRGIIESFDYNGAMDQMMSYAEGFARFIIESDNPTMIRSVEDVLYPEE